MSEIWINYELKRESDKVAKKKIFDSQSRMIEFWLQSSTMIIFAKKNWFT